MATERERLAFDRASVRTFDEDGHMRVSLTHISKANICEYYGSEIPEADALGLDPLRKYKLLRDPAELAKAAPTFNGKPILNVHRPVSADAHPAEIVIGAVGQDTVFNAPYLDASLIVWTSDAIKGVESNKQREISSAYRYDADMTPGEYEGAPYDGRMVNLRGNHIAFVETGRAGADVIVGDSAPENLFKDITDMATLSRKALLLSGFLRAYAAPRIAQDKKIDFAPVMAAVSKDWTASKPKIVVAMDAAVKDKLAKDASIGDLATLLDQFDGVNDDVADPDASGGVAPTVPDDAGNDGDADTCAKAIAFLTGKVSPEVLEGLKAVMSGGTAPAVATETKPAGAADEPQDPDMKPDLVSKTAMDAAIAATAADTRAKTVAHMNAIRKAERDVMPFVGELKVAMDSADAVYKFALDHLKVDLTGVPAAAYEPMLRVYRLPGSDTPAVKPRMGMDAAAMTDFATRFPGADRL